MRSHRCTVSDLFLEGINYIDVDSDTVRAPEIVLTTISDKCMFEKITPSNNKNLQSCFNIYNLFWKKAREKNVLSRPFKICANFASQPLTPLFLDAWSLAALSERGVSFTTGNGHSLPLPSTAMGFSDECEQFTIKHLYVFIGRYFAYLTSDLPWVRGSFALQVGTIRVLAGNWQDIPIRRNRN